MKMRKILCVLLCLCLFPFSLLLNGCGTKPEESDSIVINNSAADTSNVKETASYLGVWEAVGDSRITVTINDLEALISMEGETMKFFAYRSWDEHYVYLDLVYQDNEETPTVTSVLVLIDDDVMVLCPAGIDNNVHVGNSPFGTKFDGSDCLLLARAGSSTNQFPSNINLDEFTELCEDYVPYAEGSEKGNWVYYPDCSVLALKHLEEYVFVQKDGKLLYAESFGIKHLNAYEEDDIFTESNLVITDSK